MIKKLYLLLSQSSFSKCLKLLKKINMTYQVNFKLILMHLESNKYNIFHLVKIQSYKSIYIIHRYLVHNHQDQTLYSPTSTQQATVEIKPISDSSTTKNILCREQNSIGKQATLEHTVDIEILQNTSHIKISMNISMNHKKKDKSIFQKKYTAYFNKFNK